MDNFGGMREEWNNGKMECWNVGKDICIIPIYSSIPILNL